MQPKDSRQPKSSVSFCFVARALALAILFVVASSARAQGLVSIKQAPISVNFVGTGSTLDPADAAGVAMAPHWNNAVGTNGTLANLKNGAGASMAGTAVYWDADLGGSLPSVGTGTGNQKMMRGVINSGTADDAAITVTVSGLAGFDGYDIYVYGDTDNPGQPRTYQYTIGSESLFVHDSGSNFPNNTFARSTAATAAGAQTNGYRNYVVFEALRGDSFTLTARKQGYRVGINAIQIVPYHVPVATGADFGRCTPVSATYHVALSGNNSNPGTSTSPWRTVGFAAQRAFARQAQGLSTKVIVQNGTYRESVGTFATGVRPGPTGAMVIFEGQSPGGVIVSGADIVAGWTKSGANYHTPWTHNWGVQPWRYSIGAPPHIVRRKEVVFLDNLLLRQVLSFQELTSGTFFVDESDTTAGNRLWVQPPSGRTVTATNVAVAMRSGLWRVENRNNLVFRNLAFKRDNTYITGDVGNLSAFGLFNVANVLLENCTFAENNAHGCLLGPADDLTIQGCQFNDNGHVGLQPFKTRNLLVEHCEMNRNNWRGAWGDYTGWSPCGAKSLHSHGATWRYNTAADNHAIGLWWDTDQVNVRVESNWATRNLQQGFYLEYLQGPMFVRRNISSRNRNSGFTVDLGANVTLERNIAWANNGYGLKVRAQVARNDGANFETLNPLTLSSSDHLTLRRNVFAGTNINQGALSLPSTSYNGGTFFATLQANSNDFYCQGRSDPFLIGSSSYNFSGYAATSGQDPNSRYADPRFVDPANDNFALLPDSPVAGWGLPKAPLDYASLRKWRRNPALIARIP